MRIPGIYVEIRGDFSKFQQDMNTLRAEVRTQGRGISDALNNAISPKQATDSINRLATNLALAGRAAQASKQDFSLISAQVKNLAATVGLSEKEFAGLQSRMLQFKVQSQADKMFGDIQRATGMTNKEMAVLRTRMGDAAGAARTLAAGSKAASVGMNQFLDSFSGLFSGIALFFAARNLARDVLDITVKIQGMEVALQAVLGSASASRAEMEWLRGTVQTLGLDLITTGEAFKLISASAVGTTISQSTVRDTFSAVSEAAVVLGLTTEDTRLVLLALSQMISKGTVYSEELRRQMGDRLPGAFSLAAQAMGVSTRALSEMLQKGAVATDEFLPKFTKILHDMYGQAAADADLLVQAQNRVSTAWSNLLTPGEGGRWAITGTFNWLAEKIEGINKGFQFWADILPKIRVLLKGLDPAFSVADISKELAELNRVVPGYTGSDALKAHAAEMQKLEMKREEIAKYTATLPENRIKQAENERDRALNMLKQMRAGTAESPVGLSVVGIEEAEYAEQVKEVWRAYEYARGKIKTEAEKDAEAATKAATHLRDITAQLEKMTDTGTEGQARMGALEKTYGDFAAKMGEGHPEVQRFAKVVEFANEHMGHTPDVVAKANREIEKQIGALEAQARELDRVNARRQDGAYLDAELFENKERLYAIEQEYNAAVESGADKAVAARKRELMLAEERRGAMERQAQAWQDYADKEDAAQRRWQEHHEKTSDDFGAGWMRGMQDVVENTKHGYAAMREMATFTADAMGGAFAEFFEEMTTSGKNAFDALGGAALNMLKSISRAFYQMLGQQIASGLFNVAGAYFGASGSTASTSTGYYDELSGQRVSTTVNARGNVLTGRGISALSGQVYDRPTYFGYDSQVRPFAKGGVLGEAGPEAVMPLTRGKDGKLGVKAEDGGGVTVVQNFNLSPGVPEAVQREVRRLMPYVQAQTISALDERNQRGRRK